MISMVIYMFVSLYAYMQQWNLSLNLLSLVTIGLWFDFLYMYEYVIPNCMKFMHLFFLLIMKSLLVIVFLAFYCKMFSFTV